jgi:UDP-glucose 4-epimerase
MAKVLVTGGAGFMGSHLVDYLINEMGFQVIMLDDLSGGFQDNLNPDAEFVQGSIVDHDLVNALFAKHQFTYVYHLAAYAAEGLSHFIKRFNYNNNLIGSVNLINASIATGVERFVFTSSIAVYGSLEPPLSEKLTPSPEDPYGIAKYAVELELKASHELFGLNYTVFRPHNVYGERQNLGDRYRNVIGIFMNRIMQGRELFIFGDGEQKRAFTYIKDIIPGIARSATMPATANQTYNIGADEPYTVNQLADYVMTALSRRVPVCHIEARKEVKVAYSDHTKFKGQFAPSTNTSLPEGLEAMAAWALSVGIRTSKRFDAIELTKNLPTSWLND